MSFFDIFRRKDDKKEDIEIKSSFISFIEKYTSIHTSSETLDKDVKKHLSGSFNGKTECSIFMANDIHYAVRFNDDMMPNEFNEVFGFLTKEFGNPDFFSEYHHYVWKKESCYLTFGLMQLNYHYEIPMVCVCRSISDSNGTIPYERYCYVADVISNVLKKWNVDTQNDGFFKINYFKDFGFATMAQSDNLIISIGYKKPELSLSVTPTKPEGNLTMLEHKKSFRKTVGLVSDSNLGKALESLFERTKEQHGLTGSDL